MSSIDPSFITENAAHNIDYAEGVLNKWEGRKVESRVAKNQCAVEMSMLEDRLALVENGLSLMRDGETKNVLAGRVHQLQESIATRRGELQLADGTSIAQAMPGKPIDQLLMSPALGLSEGEQESLEKTLNKFSRSNSDNNITFDDLKQLDELGCELANRINTISAAYESTETAALRDLQQMQHLILKLGHSVEAAVQERLDLLSEDTLSWLDEKNLVSIGNNLDGHYKCHDLYWSFQNPFRVQVSFKNCQEIIKKQAQTGFSRGLVCRPEQRRKLDNLVKNTEKVESLAYGKKYEALCRDPDSLRQIIEHKNLFLRAIRDKAIEPLADTTRPHVVVAGAGPGGLYSANIALLSGATAAVYDRRGDGGENPRVFQRENMVAFKTTFGPTLGLDMMGFKARAIQAGYIYNDASREEQVDISIKDLQKVLNEVYTNVLDGPPIQQGSFSGVSAMPIEEGTPSLKSAAIITTNDNETIELPCDRIIDGTGGSAASQTIFGEEREVIDHPTIMCTLVIRRERQVDGTPIVYDSDIGGKTRFAANLRSPDQQYLLIQVDDETQTLLQEKNEAIQSAWEALETLMEPLDESAEEESVGPAIEEAEQRLAELKEERNQLVRNVGINAALQLKRKLGEEVCEEDIVTSASFVVEIGRRNPTDSIAGTTVIRVGDALHTPDPLSGTGARFAIRDGNCVSADLQSLCSEFEKRGTPDEESFSPAYHLLMFGLNRDSDELISASVRSRSVVGTWGPLLQGLNKWRLHWFGKS